MPRTEPTQRTRSTQRTRNGLAAVPSDEQTVRLARKRFARRQWARRWLVWRRALTALVGVAAVGLVVWLVFFSSVLAVSGVQVEGVSLLSAKHVRRVAAVPVGQPLATVDLGAIAARVENLAPVASADVTRAWPGRIRIAVTERRPVAVVERGGAVRGMDADGVVFRRYAARPAGLPVVHLASGTQAPARAEAAKVVAALPPDLAAKVASVDVATIDTITLRLRDGRTVHWGSADDSEDKARVVAVLLRHKASTYDVSVPGRPTVG